MTARCGIVVVVAVLITAATVRGDASFDQYEVLIERNLFVRDRAGLNRQPEPPPQIEERDVPIEQPMVPEQLHVLRGLVFEGDEPLAFIENTQERSTRAYRQGDVIAGGRIAAITILHVQFEKDQRRVNVSLGHDLRGAPAAAGSVPIGANGAEHAAPPASGGNSLEERMRQRSAQERGSR